MPKLHLALRQALKLTKKHCVYVDRTTEEVSRPFYVGEGTQVRVHTFSPLRRNKIHQSISSRYGITRTIEFESDDQNECFDKEHELVMHYKTYVGGGEGWWGANKDSGGRGGASTPKSIEHREKIRQANVGRIFSQEHRNALSEGSKGKKLSPEHRQKIGVSGKLAFAQGSESLHEARRKGAILANQRRWSKPMTPEEHKRHSDAAKLGCARRKAKKEIAQALLTSAVCSTSSQSDVNK